jgi:hypothetical protein
MDGDTVEGRSMRATPFFLGALACVVLGGGAIAHAAPGIGDPAPAFEGKAFINTPKVSLHDLKGQVILYEVFRTW